MGGTTTRIASSKDLESIHKSEKFPTHKDLFEQKKLVTNTIQNLIDGENVEYICMGVPGMVDKKERVFENIVNYPQLSGQTFESFFDLTETNDKLLVENDAALAGLGEAGRGEAQDHSVVAYLTLSTGVGGVLIKDKMIDDIPEHSEPGHMVIVEDGIEDEVCGQKGCLHAYLSGAMFEKTYFCNDPKATFCEGERPEDTNDKKIWKEYGKHLATGLTNIIAMWDPQIVVIGGSISNKWDLFSPSMFDSLNDQALFEVPKVVRSTLGDDNGLLGGLDLIKGRRN